MLAQAGRIALKDLRIEARRRQVITAVLPFAATIIVVFGLAFGSDRPVLRSVAPGLLWMAMLFACVLLIRGSFEVEVEDDALDGLLLAPVDRAAIFLGKTAAVTVHLAVLGVVLSALVIGVYDAPPVSILAVVTATVLGALGLASIGTLFGALTASVRAREALLPLLILPLATPLLIAAVQATSQPVVSPARDLASWVGLLGVFDIVAIALGMLSFGLLLED